jgi:hypothetical protein
MTPNDILLTGMHRSGTTLACFLLNKLSDAVALVEPMNPKDILTEQDPRDRLRVIQSYLSTTRSNILSQGKAVSKHVDGRIPDNLVGIDKAETGLRKSLPIAGEVEVRKSLDAGFSLVVKHPRYSPRCYRS